MFYECGRLYLPSYTIPYIECATPSKFCYLFIVCFCITLLEHFLCGSQALLPSCFILFLCILFTASLRFFSLAKVMCAAVSLLQEHSVTRLSSRSIFEAISASQHAKPLYLRLIFFIDHLFEKNCSTRLAERRLFNHVCNVLIVQKAVEMQHVSQAPLICLNLISG